MWRIPAPCCPCAFSVTLAKAGSYSFKRSGIPAWAGMTLRAAVMTSDLDLVIAGGGPAGVMAGFLFARAGCRVEVLEKHADFFRDFRGDTVHPSTLELLRELGLLEEFLKRPHDEVRTLTARVADRQITIADMSHLPVESRFVALMPQWHFLDFLADEGGLCPTFDLRMEAKAVDLLIDQGEVTGVRLEDGEE